MPEAVPVAVFAFNRPDLFARTLTALAANDLAEQSALTIFCDGPRHEGDEAGVREVRRLARAVTGFAGVEVVERPRNMGCAASIIDGLTEMFGRHERLIVIEDDILTSPHTLRFLNEGLERYADNDKVFNISAWTPPHIARNLPAGYPHDTYAIPRFNCWGWASWRDRFQDIDWEVKDYPEFKNNPQLREAYNAGGDDLSPMLDLQMEGKINSWCIRADYARFKKGMLGINPVRSYTLNIGMGSGTHTTTATTWWDSDISQAVANPRFRDLADVNPRIQGVYRDCYVPRIPASNLSATTILSINSTSSGDDAAEVTQRLCHLMAQRGLNMPLLTGSPSPGEDAALQMPRGTRGLPAWCRWLGLPDYHIQTSDTLADHSLFQQADLIHLHNLHGGWFNIWSLPHLSALRPIVWTLHDMWPLTGHCAWPLDCERWLPEIGCGACPHLADYPGLEHDTTHRLWRDKRMLYAHSSLHLVTPSVWLQRLVEKSMLREHPLACIPCGVNTDIYKAQTRTEVRRRLGLPENALLVGGCANEGAGLPPEGGKYLVRAARALKREFPGLVFVNIGGGDIPAELHAGWVRSMAPPHGGQELADLYAAFDLMLYPALADAHALTCVKSLCCGTPVAGFAAGAVPEVVRHGQDGLLVPAHAGEELIKAAAQLLRDEPLRLGMGRNAALDAALRYNLDLYVRRYEKVCEEALSRPIPARTGLVPLRAVPAVVKSTAFMRQYRNLCGPLSFKENLSLKFHKELGHACRRLCGKLGRSRRIGRLVRRLLQRRKP